MKIRRAAGLRPLMLSSVALPAVLAVALVGTSAMAQDAPQPAGAGAPTGQTAQNNGNPQTDTNQVGEVVVTAQFRAQDLQSTPLAITAVTSDMLRARSQTDVAQVAKTAPGVQLTTGSLGGAQTTSINIRGIGQVDFNLALEPGVGMYIDDVYYGTLFGSLFDLIDVDRVEVLRGPQGTLAGKNSEGGAVKLYSKQPSASNSTFIEGTFGTYARRELRAGTNFTIVPDKLFLRVTGIGEFRQGYVKSYDYQCATGQPAADYNSPPSMSVNPRGIGNGCVLSRQGGKNVIGLRAALKWVPNEKIDDTLTYDDMHDRSDPPPAVLIAQGPWNAPGFNTPGAPPNARTANFVPPAGSYYNFATYCGLEGTPQAYCVKPESALDSWGLSNNLNIKLADNLNLTSISAVRHFAQTSVSDQDGSPMSWLQNAWGVKYTQWSQELRLNGQFGPMVNWTVGGFWFKSHAEQDARVSLDGAANEAATFDFLEFDPVRNESKSAFAHVEFNPIDPLTLTAGVRYTKDMKFFQYGRAYAPGYGGSFLDGSIAPLNGLNGTYRGDRWDYRFTADYKFTRDVSAYVQTATGYKGGGYNPRPYYATQVQPFNPETVTSYEVGVKSYLMDRRIRLNVSGYFNNYKNIQLTLNQCPTFVPAGAPQLCAMNANAGNAHIKGFEAEAEIHPIANALIDANVSYVDFAYQSVNPATGIHLGDRPPYVPEWKFAIGAQYKYEIENLGSLTPRIDFNWIGSQQTNTINYAETLIPSYGLLNARLTWNNDEGDWSVALEATNLLNKYYAITKTWSLPPVTNSFQYGAINPGMPRMVAVTVRKTF